MVITMAKLRMAHASRLGQNLPNFLLSKKLVQVFVLTIVNTDFCSSFFSMEMGILRKLKLDQAASLEAKLAIVFTDFLAKAACVLQLW